MQENFFLLYHVNCSDVDDPCDVIWLVDVTVNAVVGNRYPVNSFELKTRNRYVVVCAASTSVMEKWMQRLSFCSPWFDVEEYRLRSPRSRSEATPSKSILHSARRKIRHAT